MDPEARNELVVVLAGLAGIVFGHVARRLMMTPHARAQARFSGIGAPSLVATPALARAIGDAAGVERDRTAVQAMLAFVTGMTLTLFAEEIGRHVPALPGRDRPDER